ncbi:MAG: GNAT family N-acetyltransferase [Candidatus Competibacterales bacterium]
MEIQDARREHAKALAHLINLAGEGLPEYLWRDMAEGDESPMAVGERRAARQEGGFSYTNARVCLRGDEVLGALVAYRQPDPFIIDDIDTFPAIIRPLLELESLAPGSFYINALATAEDHRRQGVATALLKDALARGRSWGCASSSLIVASENTEATALYQTAAFAPVAARPVVPFEGHRHGGEWILLVKPLL